MIFFDPLELKYGEASHDNVSNITCPHPSRSYIQEWYIFFLHVFYNNPPYTPKICIQVPYKDLFSWYGFYNIHCPPNVPWYKKAFYIFL